MVKTGSGDYTVVCKSLRKRRAHIQIYTFAAAHGFRRLAHNAGFGNRRNPRRNHQLATTSRRKHSPLAAIGSIAFERRRKRPRLGRDRYKTSSGSSSIPVAVVGVSWANSSSAPAT